MPYSSELLKQLRKKNEWTIRDLAKRAGVSSSTVYGAENAENPGIKTVAKILKAFGLEIQLVEI